MNKRSSRARIFWFYFSLPLALNSSLKVIKWQLFDREFYIVVLGVPFFLSPFIYFPYSIWTFLSLLFWAFISLFYLDFYFPFLDYLFCKWYYNDWKWCNSIKLHHTDAKWHDLIKLHPWFKMIQFYQIASITLLLVHLISSVTICLS